MLRLPLAVILQGHSPHGKVYQILLLKTAGGGFLFDSPTRSSYFKRDTLSHDGGETRRPITRRTARRRPYFLITLPPYCRRGTIPIGHLTLLTPQRKTASPVRRQIPHDHNPNSFSYRKLKKFDHRVLHLTKNRR